MGNIKEIKEKLAKYEQAHVLRFYDSLSGKEKETLLNQIEKIDFDLMKKLYENREEYKEEKSRFSPIPYVDKSKLEQKEIDRYTMIGENIIKSNKFAFVTLAGGQGTRLGHNGPKGTFMLGIKPDKSLFEIMCDSLKRAYEKYEVYIPWYIMTSRDNNEDTIKFFEQNNYFDYPIEKIRFFIQGELPMISDKGYLLLEKKGKIKEGADGHGGIFEAMSKNNIIVDMEDKGIEWVFIGGIDNVLLKIVDPLFIGMAKDNDVKLAGKSIVKANPEEKVGVFCKRNGRPSVMEYSEITEKMANACDENGELLYGESHILCNLFSIEALRTIGTEKLPYHTAYKNTSYVDDFGSEHTPLGPNAYKFETFIFDAFSMFDNMLILRTLREEEFAPIKNKEGVDSPKTARELYTAFWGM